MIQIQNNIIDNFQELVGISTIYVQEIVRHTIFQKTTSTPIFNTHSTLFHADSCLFSCVFVNRMVLNCWVPNQAYRLLKYFRVNRLGASFHKPTKIWDTGGWRNKSESMKSIKMISMEEEEAIKLAMIQTKCCMNVYHYRGESEEFQEESS